MYLRTILIREEEALIKRVFREQQANPSPGDFVELVTEDFKRIGLDYNESIVMSGEQKYKDLIRKYTKELLSKS